MHLAKQIPGLSCITLVPGIAAAECTLLKNSGRKARICAPTSKNF